MEEEAGKIQEPEDREGGYETLSSECGAANILMNL